MFKPLFKTIERLLVLVGLALLFFAGLETVRAWQTLSELHPWAGHGFLLLLAGLFAWLVWQLRLLTLLTVAPAAPELPSEGELPARLRRRWLRFFKRVHERLAANELLMQSQQERLDLLAGAIADLERDLPSGDEFRLRVEAIESDNLRPLLEHLDQRAEAAVSDSVGIVSVGTALSPWRSLDVGIVLTRNVRMVNRILTIYRTRPTAGETVRVFYDVARVVAMVNLVNAMDNVWAGLGRHVPLLGRYGEALSEGLFSGLLTSVAGHAAIDRSRSYRSFSTEAAAREYRGRLHRWARDVFAILRRHGIDRLLHRQDRPDRDSEAGDAAPSRGLKRFFGR